MYLLIPVFIRPDNMTSLGLSDRPMCFANALAGRT